MKGMFTKNKRCFLNINQDYHIGHSKERQRKIYTKILPFVLGKAILRYFHFNDFPSCYNNDASPPSSASPLPNPCNY